jgi:hypothetical protein
MFDLLDLLFFFLQSIFVLLALVAKLLFMQIFYLLDFFVDLIEGL